MLRRLIIYHHIHKNIHFVHKIYNVFEVINFFSNSFFLIHKSLSRSRCWIEICLCFENLLTPYALFFISDFSLLSESETTINIRLHAVPASCYSFKVNTGTMCEICNNTNTTTTIPPAFCCLYEKSFWNGKISLQCDRGNWTLIKTNQNCLISDGK